MPPSLDPNASCGYQLVLKRMIMPENPFPRDLRVLCERNSVTGLRVCYGFFPPSTSRFEQMNLFLQNQLNPAPFTKDP